VPEGSTAGQAKPHLTLHQQLDVLRSRGLALGEPPEALRSLQRFGYYRLSGYAYPLRNTKPKGESGRLDTFVPGASLPLVVQLAEFDKQLRLLVLHGVETVEVAVRVAVAHRMGAVHTEAHLYPKLLASRFVAQPREGTSASSGYDAWLKAYRRNLQSSKEDFVAHHNEMYGGRLPIWAAVEIWNFGLLSKFFAGMQLRDQNAVAAQFGGLDGHVLKSWLRTLNFLRNVAAHHSRLWNRAVPDVPVLPSRADFPTLDFLHLHPRSREKLLGALSCLWFLVQAIEPDSGWAATVKAHLATFPSFSALSLEQGAGFFHGWAETDLWK